MERLPAEIWQQVAFACDIKTAKNLRCTSKAFGELAARAIFRDVYMSTLEESVRNVRKIAHCKTLQPHVRRLTFLNAVLDENYLDYDHFERELDLRTPIDYSVEVSKRAPVERWRQAPKILVEGEDTMRDEWLGIHTMTISRERLKLLHERFVSLFWAQNRILQTKRQKRALETVVEAFPNLNVVKLYGIQHIYCSPPAFLDEHKTPTPFLTRLQLDTFLSGPFDHTEWMRDSFVDPDYSQLAKPIYCILQALGRSGRQVRVLDLDVVPWSIWHETASTVYWRQYDPSAKMALQNLQSLSARFYLSGTRDPDVQSDSISLQISQFLSCASSLTIANLDFADCGDPPSDDEESREKLYEWYDRDIANVSCIFEHVSWPKLRELRVRRCGLTQDVFTTFMKRHRSYLRVLTISDLQLAKPITTTHSQAPMTDWQPTFEAIAPLMSLEVVQIKHLLDDAQRRHNDMTYEEVERIPFGERVPFTNGSWEALLRWRKHCRQVSDYLQCGGSGPYPKWSDQNSRFYGMKHEMID